MLAAALAGLDAREASDATLTVRSGHADDADACERFVQELEAMYVGWADGRGMRIRRNGATGRRVLEISGLGAYTLLKSEAGCTCSSSRTTTTAASTASPRSSRSTRRERARTGIAESRRSCDATATSPRRSSVTPPGMRTGRIDRVLAGDFDLLGDAAPD